PWESSARYPRYPRLADRSASRSSVTSSPIGPVPASFGPAGTVAEERRRSAGRRAARLSASVIVVENMSAQLSWAGTAACEGDARVDRLASSSAPTQIRELERDRVGEACHRESTRHADRAAPGTTLNLRSSLD